MNKTPQNCHISMSYSDKVCQFGKSSTTDSTWEEAALAGGGKSGTGGFCDVEGCGEELLVQKAHPLQPAVMGG